MDEVILFLFMILLLILSVWNYFIYRRFLKLNMQSDNQYHELNAKLNFIIAVGSFAILIISYFGFDVKADILNKSKEPIMEMVRIKSHEIDSLLESKNILKAGIYIVTDLEYKENKVYEFKNLFTIDEKHLPDFAYVPKLMIITNTGENLRIEKVTNEFFTLTKPISKNGFLLVEQENPDYPEVVKFDIWIADYKTK